ncbi:metallophosphoesterase [Corallococcus sp. H22C18031201]|uniref:metallophosphoesterase family protein n=1 Tax=Citreicoccus inhibens TaxID=2849499 RepID=UPI000E728F38|nr:metallophosphoesterase [Citreicoccus inhibens]MBU8900509.1 metallophosphoesterase [Citreicoccus inhibens]RJS16580.1 metallophosphoesterase [Corallococcus sp. H22C18031201]
MRFLHCSDVHITEDYLALPWRKLGWRRWLALAELSVGGRARAYRQARRTLATLAADTRALGADHFILSGDLTAYALEAEFQGARSALGSLAADPRRCTVIPGNHDVYTPGSQRTGRFARHFGHLMESDLPEHRREGPYPFVRLVGEGAAVVGLCSARVPPAPGIAAGYVGKAQLEGLAAVVADPRLARRALLVAVHHAPRTAQGAPDHRLHGLRDADALLGLLRGPRFAVLHGHIHQRYHLPATADRPHLFGAGSSTEAGHEGGWLIEVSGGAVVGGQRHAPRL